MSVTPIKQGFAYWQARFAAHENRITDAMMTEIAAHPAFSAATYAHIRGTLAMHASNPMSSRLANDITRVILGFITLYLDARDGLTRSAVRDLIASVGLASPGRATAILMQLYMFKFIELNPHQPDRRARRYVPTPAMKKAFIELACMGMDATALMEPEAATFAHRFSDPLFFQGYVLDLGAATLTMLRNLRQTERDMFGDSTSGYLMLYRLMLGGNESVYPPRGPLPFSRAALAREFKVSHSHVSRVFDAAARRGHVVYSADRSSLTFTESFRQQMTQRHAAMFLNNIRCLLGATEHVRQMLSRAA